MEKRLYGYQEKYRHRREEMKERFQEEELRELRSPEINKQSAIIVSSMNVHIPAGEPGGRESRKWRTA